MHTEPRGQGGLPWRLRLNALLGCADSSACPGFGNHTTAALWRRLHNAGEVGRIFRERRNHKLTIGRDDEERWHCPARSACAGHATQRDDEGRLHHSRGFGCESAAEARRCPMDPGFAACEA